LQENTKNSRTVLYLWRGWSYVQSGTWRL